MCGVVSWLDVAVRSTVSTQGSLDVMLSGRAPDLNASLDAVIAGFQKRLRPALDLAVKKRHPGAPISSLGMVIRWTPGWWPATDAASGSWSDSGAASDIWSDAGNAAGAWSDAPDTGNFK
jgi:hypothetical protein